MDLTRDNQEGSDLHRIQKFHYRLCMGLHSKEDNHFGPDMRNRIRTLGKLYMGNEKF